MVEITPILDQTRKSLYARARSRETAQIYGGDIKWGENRGENRGQNRGRNRGWRIGSMGDSRGTVDIGGDEQG